jgi:hypothetical protein
MGRRGDSELAELRTRWFLEDLGFEFRTEERLEDWMQVCGTRPDYLVKHADGLLLVEVTCLEKERSRLPPENDEGNDFTGWSGIETHKILESIVKEKAEQISPYRDQKIPSIIVLDIVTPSDIRFDFLEGELNLLHGIRTFHTAAGEVSRRDAIFRSDQKRYISGFALQRPIPTDSALDPRHDRQRMYWTIETNPYADQPISPGLLKRVRAQGVDGR